MTRRAKPLFWTQVYQSTLILSLTVLFLGEVTSFFFFPYLIRLAFDLLGFIFDLLFTGYFLFQILQAIRYNVFKRYLKSTLWLNLLHSVVPLLSYSLPLIILNSSHPEVTQGAVKDSLWLSLFFTQTKYLRLLRFSALSLTFLPRLTQNNKSLQTIERLFLFCFFAPFGIFVVLDFGNSQLQGKTPVFETYLKDIHLPSPQTPAKTLEAEWPFILAIRDTVEEHKFLYSRDSTWQSYYGIFDYFVVKKGFISFYLDQSPFIQERARLGLFFLLLNFIIFLSLFRLNHFLLTIFVQPTQIILKGLTDPLEFRRVEIPPNYREDPIFRLAKEYNNQILPQKLSTDMKSRIPFVPKDLKRIFPVTNLVKHE